VRTTPADPIVFLDTPGVHSPARCSVIAPTTAPLATLVRSTWWFFLIEATPASVLVIGSSRPRLAEVATPVVRPVNKTDVA